MEMDQAVLHREGPRPAEYHPNRRDEFSLDELQRGHRLLQQAVGKVDGDVRLLRRVDYARFAHAILTLVRLRNDSHPSVRARAMAQQATRDVAALQAKYTMMVRRQTRLFLAPPGGTE
jgi:hypothetical protein